jgi:hypothetical protein
MYTTIPEVLFGRGILKDGKFFAQGTQEYDHYAQCCARLRVQILEAEQSGASFSKLMLKLIRITEPSRNVTLSDYVYAKAGFGDAEMFRCPRCSNDGFVAYHGGTYLCQECDLRMATYGNAIVVEEGGYGNIGHALRCGSISASEAKHIYFERMKDTWPLDAIELKERINALEAHIEAGEEMGEDMGESRVQLETLRS